MITSLAKASIPNPTHSLRISIKWWILALILTWQSPLPSHGNRFSTGLTTTTPSNRALTIILLRIACCTLVTWTIFGRWGWNSSRTWIRRCYSLCEWDLDCRLLPRPRYSGIGFGILLAISCCNTVEMPILEYPISSLQASTSSFPYFRIICKGFFSARSSSRNFPPLSATPSSKGHWMKEITLISSTHSAISTQILNPISFPWKWLMLASISMALNGTSLYLLESVWWRWRIFAIFKEQITWEGVFTNTRSVLTANTNAMLLLILIAQTSN